MGPVPSNAHPTGSPMSKHLQRDIDRLNPELLSISSMVEEMIDKATQALSERRYDLADEVVKSDEYVDQHEVHVEEECLKMLALHQPVAVDLRRIATVMKVNNDLERIADLAVSIAQRAKAMDEFPAFPIPDQLPRMVVLATQMVRGAMDAFVNMDTAAARRIMAMDNVGRSATTATSSASCKTLMQKRPELVPAALHCFSAVRHIERIADHATNIAEDVIYLVEGDIVRHRHASIELPNRASASTESRHEDVMAKTKVLVIEDDRSLAEVLIVQPQAGGLRGAGRDRRAGRPAAGADQVARHRGARPDAAGGRWAGCLPPPAGRCLDPRHADHHAHRQGGRERRADRLLAGGRRLRHQAVQREGAAGADQGPPPPPRRPKRPTDEVTTQAGRHGRSPPAPGRWPRASRCS